MGGKDKTRLAFEKSLESLNLEYIGEYQRICAFNFKIFNLRFVFNSCTLGYLVTPKYGYGKGSTLRNMADTS